MQRKGAVVIRENKLSGQELRISSEIWFWGILATEAINSVPLDVWSPYKCPFLGQRVSILDCLMGMSFQIAMQIVMVPCLPGASLDFCPTAH